jgi:hypothetical protein
MTGKSHSPDYLAMKSRATVTAAQSTSASGPIGGHRLGIHLADRIGLAWRVSQPHDRMLRRRCQQQKQPSSGSACGTAHEDAHAAQV